MHAEYFAVCFKFSVITGYFKTYFKVQCAMYLYFELWKYERHSVILVIPHSNEN